MKKRKKFLPFAKPFLTAEELKAVSAVLKSGYWTTGPKTAEFEKNISEYIGNGVHCVALNSCTSGLFCGLSAYGISKGDEVIVPTWTFAATAQVVEWAGASPVLCDIDQNNLNIDVKKISELITKKTKAIIPVHIAGYACDMAELKEIAKSHSLKIIEDAAHAIGAEYKNMKIGNTEDCAVFSFYTTKNLACGEGGAVTSRNADIIEKIRKLSYFGINKQAYNRYTSKGSWFYEIEELGYKFNFDDIHAAIGIEQLKKLDAMNARRRIIVENYKKLLSDKIQYTKTSKDRVHSNHLFPILLPEGIDRDKFIIELKEEWNVGASVHFIPLHKHPYYRKKWKDSLFSSANYIFTRILSLPLFPEMTDNDVDYVANAVNTIIRKVMK